MRPVTVRPFSLILAASLALGAFLVRADGAQAPATKADAATADVKDLFDQMARRLTESMTRDLGLSSIQIPQVEKTNMTAARRIQDAALNWQPGDKEATHNLIQQAVHAFMNRESDLRAILTPDQQAMFQQQRTVRGAEMQTRLMTVTLKLSEAQAAKVSSLNLNTARRMQSALAPARDPGALPRDRYQALRAAKAVQKDKDAVMREVLDDDQWKAYKLQKEQMKEMWQEMREQNQGR